jgi:hypothetical protein
MVLDRYIISLSHGRFHIADRLTFNRELIKGTAGSSPLSRITGNRLLIRLALMAGVSLAVTGAVQAGVGTKQKTIDLGKHLKTIAIIIFLVIAALLIVHTIFSISAEARKTSGEYFPLRWLAQTRR